MGSQRSALSALAFAQQVFDAALELGPSRINRAYPAGHDSGGPRLITEPLAEAAAGSDREQRGVTPPPSMLVPNEDAGGDCDPLSQRGGVADVSQMDLGAHAHRKQGDEPAQMSGAREAWEEERDNWLEFGDRLRSIFGLGAGRGGGAGLIKVVQKELTARDKKIEMLQQTVARLESDSKHANEATQVLEAVRTRAFDKIAALENMTQRSAWDVRAGRASPPRRKTFAEKFCEASSKSSVSVPPLISNMIQNHSRFPSYSQSALSPEQGAGGGLASLGGADQLLLLPRITPGPAA